MFMTDPQPNRGFEWTQVSWGRVLRCVPLSAAVDHFYTANELELRDRQEEWTAVAQAIGVPLDDLLLIRQVHAAAVAVASHDRARPWDRPEADAIISSDRDAAIAVRVADCVPILLADETGQHVAAVHAGWRGIARRAVIAAVSALQARFGVRPERLIAAIGPCIGPCCYEVGESTRQAFREAGHHASILDKWFAPRDNGKYHLDLWQATRDELEGAGVNPDTIHLAGLCTRTHADRFHSYRVQGDRAGRMAAVIRTAR
jgi:purine-nucleoside/S-methyl-5'-thioadenosine phosphorylase / adenosine deaminase